MRWYYRGNFWPNTPDILPGHLQNAGPQMFRIRAALAATLPEIPGLLPADLVLSGCQAIDDLDGFMAPLLAGSLDLPYLGLVSRISVDPSGGTAVVVSSGLPEVLMAR